MSLEKTTARLDRSSGPLTSLIDLYRSNLQETEVLKLRLETIVAKFYDTPSDKDCLNEASKPSMGVLNQLSDLGYKHSTENDSLRGLVSKLEELL